MAATTSTRSNKPGQRRPLLDNESQIDVQVEALVLPDRRITLEQIVQRINVSAGSGWTPTWVLLLNSCSFMEIIWALWTSFIKHYFSLLHHHPQLSSSEHHYGHRQRHFLTHHQNGRQHHCNHKNPSNSHKSFEPVYISTPFTECQTLRCSQQCWLYQLVMLSSLGAHQTIAAMNISIVLSCSNKDIGSNIITKAIAAPPSFFLSKKTRATQEDAG